MNWQPTRQGNRTLQQQIVTWITERIERGDWVAGTKLPTQRQLAMQLGVNRSTVQQALEELKAAGILETTIGSGIYVANTSWHTLIKHRQPNWQTYIETSLHKPNYHTIQLINEYEQRDSIIRLGTGELAPSLLPTREIEASLKEISLLPKVLGYSSPQGNKQLREAICQYAKKGVTGTTRKCLHCFGWTTSITAYCSWFARARFHRISGTNILFKFCSSIPICRDANGGD
ncbi:hypothetical protein LSPH24S_09096 [Lysinibacillus sphaericus]